MKNAQRQNAPKVTVSMPRYELGPGIFEIDEFDCASVFLVKGEDRALLIDTGVGIGDLRQFVEDMLDGMPYEVIATHNHMDHIGGAAWFDSIWIHPADLDWSTGPAVPTLESRRSYAEMIRRRERKEYPYDPETDIRSWPREPLFRALRDGQVFDLGGRRIAVHHCPGHTPGEIVLTDDLTKTLLCGDACNCNWLLSSRMGSDRRDCAEKALRALQRIMSLQGSEYAADRVINSHHDYRPAGQPLAAEVMPDLISCLESILEGRAQYESVPDPLRIAGDFKTAARYGSVMVSMI